MQNSNQHSVIYLAILLTVVDANIPRLRNSEYDANMDGLDNYYMSSNEKSQDFSNSFFGTSNLYKNIDETLFRGNHKKIYEDSSSYPFQDKVKIIRQPGPNNKEIISLDINSDADYPAYPEELTREKHDAKDIEERMKEMDIVENPDLLVALFLNILKNKYPEKLTEMKEILNRLTDTKDTLRVNIKNHSYANGSDNNTTLIQKMNVENQTKEDELQKHDDENNNNNNNNNDDDDDDGDDDDEETENEEKPLSDSEKSGVNNNSKNNNTNKEFQKTRYEIKIKPNNNRSEKNAPFITEKVNLSKENTVASNLQQRYITLEPLLNLKSQLTPYPFIPVCGVTKTNRQADNVPDEEKKKKLLQKLAIINEKFSSISTNQPIKHFSNYTALYEELRLNDNLQSENKRKKLKARMKHRYKKMRINNDDIGAAIYHKNKYKKINYQKNKN